MSGVLTSDLENYFRVDVLQTKDNPFEEHYALIRLVVMDNNGHEDRLFVLCGCFARKLAEELTDACNYADKVDERKGT